MRGWAPLRNVLLATTALAPLGIAVAVANPLAPNVVGGSAAVTGVGTSSVTVNQSSPRAIINWNSFNIGAGEATRFVQPDASSVALNRVTGGLGPSQLHGMLSANGRVFLVNPDGILIGRGATINTAGFLATTNDITNDNFMAGRYQFNIPGRPDASIVNEGTINSHSHGFAALVAPGVRNSGTITAKFGKIGLAAGNSFTLDFYGDQLITLAVGDTISATVRDVATGQPLKALVTNEGKLKATGGRVELTAASARTVVDAVINNTGVIEARSIGHRNGKIVLGGQTAATKVAGLPTQTVKVSGTLSTASRKGKGGTIQVTGESIEVTAASFDASGRTGGGKVLIGGDTGGGTGHWAVGSIPQAGLEAKAVPTATRVSIDAATKINASATSVGDGGKVIVWADGATAFAGQILARGGDTSGNGGFVEVSGKQTLNYTGTADLRAPAGSFGTLLLDPENYTIWNGVGPTPSGPSITNSALQTQLASGNVVIATNNATGTDPGDILVNANVTWSSSSTLTLSAYHDIVFDVNVNMTNTGAGHLVVRADSTGIGNGGTLILNNGTATERINWLNSTGTVTVFYNPTSYATPTNFTVGNGRVGVASPSQFTSYMLVNNGTDLSNVGNNLSGNYAVGRSFSSTVPIGNNMTSGTFTGIFDGLNNTISNVVVSTPAWLGTNAGTIRNLTMQNWSVSATAPNQNVAILAGTNTGTISNVNSSGTVNGGNLSGVTAGGLAARNAGTITNSYSLANVSSSGTNVMLGGLVGLNQTSAIISNSYATGNVTASGNVPANCNPGCQSMQAGGLAGVNQGTITGDAGAFKTFATGAVSVGSNAVGGGLVGNNSGLIYNAFAGGAVTGLAGAAVAGDQFQMQTALGGLAGINRGLVMSSLATGNVGAPVDHLTAGGLAGINSGAVVLSTATGNVTAGNFSQAGGLVGNGNADCPNCGLGDGLVFDNTNFIGGSFASGTVTVGQSSFAGGLAGSGSVIYDSHTSSAVVGGANSLLGGFVGLHNINGLIYLSTANGSVTGTGANSWLGGFVGYNGGAILSSFSSAAVNGTSDSILGGFAGVNIGWLSGLTSIGSVFASGGGNVIGGFGGANFGTIDTSTSTGAATGAGANNIVGGFLGANAQFINFPPGLIPYSSFPVGTVSNSSGSGTASGGPGSTVQPQIGVTNPTTLPAYPSIFTGCDHIMCQIFLTGILGGGQAAATPEFRPVIPNQVLAQPNFDYLFERFNQLPPLDALIQLTNLNSTPPAGNQQQSTTTTTAPPGTPPRSVAPPRPLRAVPGPDGEIRSNIPPPGETRFLANEVILQVMQNTPAATVQQIAQQLGLTLVASQPLTVLGRVSYRFQINNGRSVTDNIVSLEANGLTAIAMPNYSFFTVQAPAAIAPVTSSRGDPAQYSMGKLNLNEAHRVSSGNNITIAIIDSDVDREHAELAGTILERYDATDTEARAHSHGTAMAGAIVSRARLLGVAPGAKILAVRAFTETQTSAESTSFTILKGMDWAVSQGARIINMSFAGPYDPALERVLKDAAAKGVIMIGASGNAGPKSAPLWPGADPHVIAVTATDSGDKLFRQANRGPYVSVASPGVEILAPAPQAGYQMSTGTSIATAHISGVVALMLERDPSLTPLDVRLVLESTASDLGPKGRDVQFGWGLVNPARALAMVEERRRQRGAASTPVQR